jgi:dTDP-4-amino-4,6-dideoxygalactose transaminase
MNRDAAGYPVADEAAATALALPIFGELTDAQQRHVVGAIADFVEAEA